jgi:hypothetical protein
MFLRVLTTASMSFTSPIDGSIRKYYPDFLVIERSGQKTIIEIKSAKELFKAKIILKKRGRPSKKEQINQSKSLTLKSKITTTFILPPIWNRLYGT